MKIIEKSYRYLLENFETNTTQELRFVLKIPISPIDSRLEIAEDGTTNEEVLKVLIDRMQYLQAKNPCRENALVITKLEESLMWLEKRTKDRITRGVEGTYAK